MKSFFQFLGEARSEASLKAQKLNLKSDGHGGWLDSRGKFVATTEDGKLKFVDKKKARVKKKVEKRNQQHSSLLLPNLLLNQKHNLNQKQIQRKKKVEMKKELLKL